jgi:hypothetical protein
MTYDYLHTTVHYSRLSIIHIKYADYALLSLQKPLGIDYSFP